MTETQTFEQPQSPEVLAQQELDAFLYNPGLAEVAKLFTVDDLPKDRTERLAALQNIANEHLDFRKGKERQDTEADKAFDEPGSEAWSTVFKLGDKLGLVEASTPRNTSPDSLLVLGGANKAPLQRLHYALESVDDFGQIAYLGSDRKLKSAEQKVAASYAPGAQTEFDLGCAAFESIGGRRVGEARAEQRGDSECRVQEYEFDYEYEENGKTKQAIKRGFVLSAPRVVGEKRANTYDNFRFYGEVAGLADDPGHTAVAITSAHFTAGQQMPGIHELTLKYGTELETVGYDAAYAGKKLLPSQILQETKTAIGRARRLNADLQKAKAA